MKAPSKLFHDLAFNADHEGWNDFDVPTLSMLELRTLCLLLGAPKSGTKEKVSTRLLAVRIVRQRLKKYSHDQEGVGAVMADWKKEQLKWMAKEAGIWRSGNKRQLAIGLLNWRTRCRAEGQKVLVQLLAASPERPRQMGLGI